LCVSAAGVIGFVGLVIPHALRRLGIAGHLTLVPGCFLGGAALVVISDALAREAARPSELPVGVVLALLGAAAFGWIARRHGEAP
jgi:iron complex transport system permease protein